VPCGHFVTGFNSRRWAMRASCFIFNELLETDASRIARTISEEHGKTLDDARFDKGFEIAMSRPRERNRQRVADVLKVSERTIRSWRSLIFAPPCSVCNISYSVRSQTINRRRQLDRVALRRRFRSVTPRRSNR
jgi:hypothetical protein